MSERELVKSYTKKDFKLEWFSGQGAGGQHRNKHQNCCRITHIESGLRAQGTETKSRVANQKKAFERLVALMRAKEAIPKERINYSKTIRNYHAVRNEVHDKASGLKLPYTQVVGKPDLGPCIEARLRAMGQEVT